MQHHCDIAVIGAGIVGIATAYYLKALSPATSVVLVDSGQPMAFVDQLMNELHHGYSQLDNNSIRVHDNTLNASYQKPISSRFEDAPSGVDVLQDQALIRETFPSYDPTIKTVVHIRRAGAISAQQMGQLLL